MVSPATPRTVRITVVPSPACHFCDDADRTLADLASTFVIDVERVPIDSVEGRQLLAMHRPGLAPLVLVDGEFFSAGRLPRKRLAELLSQRAARVAPQIARAGHDGR